MKYTARSYSAGHSWSLVERTHEPTRKKHVNRREKNLNADISDDQRLNDK
jgi:hypothetical protein